MMSTSFKGGKGEVVDPDHRAAGGIGTGQGTRFLAGDDPRSDGRVSYNFV